jgi:hypothetical protein
MVKCYCDTGDVLFIDVEGYHSANLVKNSFRAIIQLKFTIGNDILPPVTNNKIFINHFNSYKSNFNKKLEIKNALSEDREFVKSISKSELEYGSSYVNSYLKDNQYYINNL